jgi:RNA polymerase sigma-70 factor (ECF subfamily)
MAPGLLLTADEWAEGSARVDLTPISRLRRGDAAALGAAYDDHHVRLRVFARRLVGDDAAAEDLVQEVFVTLPSTIRRMREGSSLESFLIGIAINHARHHVRAAARRRRALERFQLEPSPPRASPEEDVRGRELAAKLVRLLDELPFDQRIAFVLLEVEERSSPEAAALVGVPEVTMRTRLHAARRHLRERLAGDQLDTR